MGIVYLAERPDGGLCALKLLSSNVGTDPSFVTRFEREAQYAASLDHPNILKLYDTGKTRDGTPFLAMEYAPGTDLGVMIARNRVLSLPLALFILGQVSDALDCAHGMGLIHRDVKPGNIIVVNQETDRPHAYLCDFGLSKNPSEDTVALTRQGHFIGTTAYTAPEEILAEPRDHHVDIYSLGCVLYEALVGSPPFERDRNLDVLYAHISDPRPNVTASRPDLPPPIDAIIAKAMAISPAERYDTCAEFMSAANELLGDGAIAPRAPAFAAAPPLAMPKAPSLAAGAVSPPDAAEPPPPDAAEPPALRLVVADGPAFGRELVVEDEVMLGRLTTLDGALEDDRGISRNHGRVRRAADGGYLVEDSNSANGTFVNGVEISGPHPLRPGDELQIGSTVFKAMTAAQPAPSAEPIVQPLGITRLSIKKPDDMHVADESPLQPPIQAADEAAEIAPDPPTEPSFEGSEPPLELPMEIEPADLVQALDPDPPAAAPPVVVTMAPDAAAKRLAVRFEIDIEAGELTVTVDDSATVRIVRDGDGWRTETS